jgi:hypothetical protein
MSTTAAGSIKNGGGASSTQTNGGDLHQSPQRVLSLVQVLQGDAELDQIQMQDGDEEAEEDEAAMEEEELVRVQQEIERLRQEQESIMRRQAIAQRTKARILHINIESERGSQSYSIPSISFISKSRGRSHCGPKAAST